MVPKMNFLTLFFLLPGVLSLSLRERGLSCGVKGYDKGVDAYAYKAKSSLSNLAGCGKLCKSDADCQSFSIGGGACLLYSTTVADNFESDSSSKYKFYDRDCVATTSTKSKSARIPSASIRPTRSRSAPASRAATTRAAPSGSASCGLVGYDKGSPTAFYYSESYQNGNLASCSAICKRKSSCKSFAFSSSACLLYKATLANNFDAHSDSPYTFYDASCVSGVVSSSFVSTPSSSSDVTLSETSSTIPTSSVSSEESSSISSSSAISSDFSSSSIVSTLDSTTSSSIYSSTVGSTLSSVYSSQTSSTASSETPLTSTISSSSSYLSTEGSKTSSRSSTFSSGTTSASSSIPAPSSVSSDATSSTTTSTISSVYPTSSIVTSSSVYSSTASSTISSSTFATSSSASSSIYSSTISSAVSSSFSSSSSQTSSSVSSSSSPLQSGLVRAKLRVEGLTATIFEGQIISGPGDLTTPTGGTHHCDGTNNGANPTPGATCSGILAAASAQYGFTLDGIYYPVFDDTSIQEIGGDRTGNGYYWSYIKNSEFPPGSGCKTKINEGDEVVWAYYFGFPQIYLKLDAPTAAISNVPFVVTVTNALGGLPVPGATVGGQITDVNGQATITLGTSNVLKAEAPASVRSNAVLVTIV